MVFIACRAVIIFLVLYSYMGFPRIRVNRTTLMGAALNFIVTISFLLANQLTTAANAITILYTNPLLIALFAAVIFHEKLRSKDIIVSVIIFIGVGVCFINSLSTKGAFSGNLFALLAAAVTAIYFLYATHTKENTLQYYLLSQVLCLIVGIPFCILYPPPAITIVSVLRLVASGLVAVSIPQILISHAFKRVSAMESSLLMALEPILNPFWVTLFLKETPTLWSLLGGGIVITGVLFWCLSGLSQRMDKM